LLEENKLNLIKPFSLTLGKVDVDKVARL